MQEIPPLSTGLAAPDYVAAEPIGYMKVDILDAEPKETTDEGTITDSTQAFGSEVAPKQDNPLNKITWAQVGRVTEPGRYMYRFGWLTITTEDLSIWKDYPNAAFTLFRTATTENDTDDFRLGTFELRTNSNYAESEK